MYSEPAVGLVLLAGRRGFGQNIALPLSYIHHSLAGWMIGFEPTTDVCRPAVAAAKVTIQKRQPTKKMVQTRHLTDVVRTGSWPSETPVGIEPTQNRVAAGRLAIWLQRQVSSSGVEPDPRPSQGRVRSATPRGQKHPGPDSNRDRDFRRVLCCSVAPLHHQDIQEPTAGFAPA
jgi:hypothetical protein